MKLDTFNLWALSLHVYMQYCGGCSVLNTWRFLETRTVDVRKKGTDRVGNKDWEAIRPKLEKCIDQLDLEKYPEDLVNIATGLHETPLVYVEEAVQKGCKKMCTFGQKEPGGLQETTLKTVTKCLGRSPSVWSVPQWLLWVLNAAGVWRV